VQEAIFDSVRFQHVADSLRRVKDRFTQVLLAGRTSASSSPSACSRRRLTSRTRSATYLTKFAKFYGSMNERMDEYVRLFPVHPDYIGTFEQLIFTEKRGALVTLRDQIQAILKEVPTDRPVHRLRQVLGHHQVQLGAARRPEHRKSCGLRGAWRARAEGLHAPGLQADGAARHQRPGRASPDHGRRHPRADRPHRCRAARRLCLFQPGVEDMPGDPAENLLSMVQTVCGRC
jgi:hypothetical protein